MRPTKPGILKKKQPAQSDILAQEAQLMQQRLEELKEHMLKEKAKRDAEGKQKDGSRWRAGRSDMPIKGHVEQVLAFKPRQSSSAKSQTRNKAARDAFVEIPALQPQQSLKAAANIQRAIEPSEKKSTSTAVQSRDQGTDDYEPIYEPQQPAKAWLYEEIAWNPQDAVIASAPQAHSAGISTSTQDMLETAEGSTATKEKLSCWECYQLFDDPAGIAAEGKRFCGSKCLVKYEQSQSVKCACGKELRKTQAVFEQGVYYCSKKCIQPILDPLPPLPAVLPEAVEESSEEESFICIDPMTGDPIE
jgi:hypothetical protein